MDLRNCPRCDKLFVYTTRKICPTCVTEDEQEYQQVKEYVWEHRGCSVMEVHEATGVAYEKILNYLREGRLEAKYFGGDLLFCDTCGDPINQGRFCPGCADNLAKGFKGQDGGKPGKPGAGSQQGMFIANRIKKR